MKNYQALRCYAAVHRNTGVETLRTLSRDPVPLIAAAATIHERCPLGARWNIRRDQYLRGVLSVMRGWRWGVRLAVTQSPRSWSGFLCAIIGRREILNVGADTFQDRVYNAENTWRRRSGINFYRFTDPNKARQFCQQVITLISSSRSYTHAAEISNKINVVFDGRLRSFAAVAIHHTMTVRISPKHANCDILLHELAHLLVDENPRFYEHPPPLGIHGDAFTATMSDLVGAVYGQKERNLLRRAYKRHGAAMFRS